MGVNGDQADNSLLAAGSAYVFVRHGDDWSQQAYLKASNPGKDDTFSQGTALAISGTTVVVGAVNESSDATGVDGNQGNNNALNSGAAYVFTGVGSQPPPELRLSAARVGDLLQLTATGTTNTQWRLEWCDTLTGTDAWQSLTDILVGTSPVVVQGPLDGTNRFYRGLWLP